LGLKDVAARRAYLAGELPGLPLSGEGTDPAAFAAPVHIDTIEWFASGADLVRTLDALRRLAEARPAAPGRDASLLRGVLAVNPGLPAARESFEWAGYKGGSETGVLSLNWLLHARDGQWYALACAWNDTSAAVDDGQLTGLLSRALQLLGKGGRGSVRRLEQQAVQPEHVPRLGGLVAAGDLDAERRLAGRQLDDAEVQLVGHDAVVVAVERPAQRRVTEREAHDAVVARRRE